jgi:hypothetical protein
MRGKVASYLLCLHGYLLCGLDSFENALEHDQWINRLARLTQSSRHSGQNLAAGEYFESSVEVFGERAA